MGLPVQRERSDVESGTPEPFSPEMLADPYPAYSAMRERGRIQRTAAGHWLVLGYDEVSQLLTDQRLRRGGRQGWPHQTLAHYERRPSPSPGAGGHHALCRPAGAHAPQAPCEQSIHAAERAEDAPAYPRD